MNICNLQLTRLVKRLQPELKSFKDISCFLVNQFNGTDSTASAGSLRQKMKHTALFTSHDVRSIFQTNKQTVSVVRGRRLVSTLSQTMCRGDGVTPPSRSAVVAMAILACGLADLARAGIVDWTECHDTVITALVLSRILGIAYQLAIFTYVFGDTKNGAIRLLKKKSKTGTK